MIKLKTTTLIKKTESIQHSASIAMTDVIRGTARGKLYPELGLLKNY